MVKFGVTEALTVRELKKALEGVADDLPVTIFLGKRFCVPEGVHVDDFMGVVKKAGYKGGSSISSPEFEIEMGDTFGY